MNYGVVAEFNPFHNGHKYLIDALKARGDTVTAVMSGSFVQRGECACISPYERTEMALKNGVDLVLSLPVQYSTATAERFAYGGIKTLTSLGVIDGIGFGSECGDEVALGECARALTSDDFSSCLNKYLDKGDSFPVARQKAITDMLGEGYGNILASPNNILGVEYIKALLSCGAEDVSVKTVSRKGASHDSSEVSDNICSASALRGMLKSDACTGNFMPEATAEILEKAMFAGKAPADYGRLAGAILYRLRTMTVDDIAALPDVSEGLEYRIYDAIRTSVTLDEILEKIKTKRYTHSRLRRIILCAFLGLTREDVQMPVPYIRVLGFNEKGAALLKAAKKKATLPIITKSSDIKSLGDDAKRCFELECKARDLFSLALPTADICGREMTDKIIIL